MRDVLSGQTEKDPSLTKILELLPPMESIVWQNTNVGDSNKYRSRVWKGVIELNNETDFSELINTIGPSIVLTISEIKELIIQKPHLLNGHGLEILSYILASN